MVQNGTRNCSSLEMRMNVNQIKNIFYIEFYFNLYN